MLEDLCQSLVHGVPDVLDWYEVYHSSSWRRKALDTIYEHVCADDSFTHGISIGPVSDARLSIE